MASRSAQPSGAPAQQRTGAVSAAGGVAAADVAAGGVPAAAGAATAAALVAGLGRFLAERDAADQAWLRHRLASRGTPADIRRAIARERAFGAVFAQRQAARLRADIAAALAITDIAEREQAIRRVLEREQRFAEQRAEAMAVRAFATLERFALKRASPQGAYWVLGKTRTHDSLCVGMAGRFWPWAVLDVTHPQHQPNCQCELVGYRDAVRRGLMSAGDVSDVKDALARAAVSMREFDAGVAGELDGLVEERELRERLVAQGLTTWERLAEVDGDGR